MEYYLRVVKESEQDLIRELVPARLEALDEEELLALHRRVRRARNKHTKNYRRKAAASVAEEAGRGAAHPKGGKSRHRAIEPKPSKRHCPSCRPGWPPSRTRKPSG